MPPPILLYDGVCGLCNRLVQFILRHDRKATFRFAALQSPLAARILLSHGKDPADLDTVYVVLNHDPSAPPAEPDVTKASPTASPQPRESLLARSDAVLFILDQLGGIWSPIAFVLRAVPRPIRDWAYGIVARTRYRIFGRYDTCPLPTAATRARFLDL
jgi:predicted DCC family thiol-disulfide oxidoreductase YuxK